MKYSSYGQRRLYNELKTEEAKNREKNQRDSLRRKRIMIELAKMFLKLEHDPYSFDMYQYNYDDCFQKLSLFRMDEDYFYFKTLKFYGNDYARFISEKVDKQQYIMEYHRYDKCSEGLEHYSRVDKLSNSSKKLIDKVKLFNKSSDVFSCRVIEGLTFKCMPKVSLMNLTGELVDNINNNRAVCKKIARIKDNREMY